MKTLTLFLLSLCLCFGQATNDLYYQTKEATGYSANYLTPSNGKLLSWNGNTLENLDGSKTFAPISILKIAFTGNATLDGSAPLAGYPEMLYSGYGPDGGVRYYSSSAGITSEIVFNGANWVLTVYDPAYGDAVQWNGVGDVNTPLTQISWAANAPATGNPGIKFVGLVFDEINNTSINKLLANSPSDSRNALGLGALATVTPGTNVATSLAIAADATGGIFRQGQALSASTVTASGAGTYVNPSIALSDQKFGIYKISYNTFGLTWDSADALQYIFSYRKITFGSNHQLLWTSGSGANYGTVDVGITRSAAGVLEVNNGTAGTLRDITVRNLTASGTVTATGKISASAPAYANDAAADADATLLSGQFYKLTGSRAILQKP